MRQIASIWLPHWPIERQYRQQDRWQRRQQRPGQPAPDKLKGDQQDILVLTETLNQTQKLYAASPGAQALSLAAGMTLAEARAIAPDLQTAPANPEADMAALTALTRWCERYTPLAGPDGLDGLLLDITGCGHLFGGEQALIDDLIRRLAKAGVSAQAAVAASHGAAWALARHQPQLVPAEHTEAALAPLPVHALRLHANTVTTLHRLGLKRIGDLTDLPRPALARRFRGQPAKDVSDLLMRLDQALGRKPEPLNPLTPLPSWRVRHAFPEPVLHREPVELALQSLMQDLLERMAAAELGVRRLSLSAFRIDGSVQTLTIGTSMASRKADHLLRLFDEKLDALEAGYGFDMLMLSVQEAEQLMPAQVSAHADRTQETTSAVLDRLGNRLGPGAVLQLKHRESHIPERAQGYAPALAGPLGWQHLPAAMAPRPCRLLMRPEAIEVIAEVPEGAPRRFRWRRVEHQVTKAEGPERIASEWWLAHDEGDLDALTRDYYRIEVSGGARFWLFRRGLYGVPGVRPPENTEGQTPHWFLHGFFA